MKLAKNDLIWPVSHPRTMPIVYQMSTLFLIRASFWLICEYALDFEIKFFSSSTIDLRHANLWRSGVELPHPPPKKKAMRPPPSNRPPCPKPQIALKLPMFTLTLLREKRKKISEVFRRLPKLTQSWAEVFRRFSNVAQRIRKVSRVRQSTLKTYRFLIYWLTEIQWYSLFCYIAGVFPVRPFIG